MGSEDEIIQELANEMSEADFFDVVAALQRAFDDVELRELIAQLEDALPED